MHIGEFLKQYRLHFKKSQSDLASDLGIGTAGKKRLEKWEQLKGSPKEEDAVIIKKFFGVKLLSELTEDYLQQIITEQVPHKTTRIESRDIQSRLLRIEANLEVFQIAIASLKAKRNEDFGQKFSELQTLIEEAVKRRSA